MPNASGLSNPDLAAVSLHSEVKIAFGRDLSILRCGGGGCADTGSVAVSSLEFDFDLDFNRHSTTSVEWASWTLGLGCLVQQLVRRGDRICLPSRPHSRSASVSGGNSDGDGVLFVSCKSISSSSCHRAKSKKCDSAELAELSSSAENVKTERGVLVEGGDATRSP